MNYKYKRIAIFLFLCFLFTACARADKRVYCHDSSYTKAMYMYLKGEFDFQEQLALMNHYFEKASLQGKKVAPGAYAHYALLKFKTGDEDEMLNYLEKEKEAFHDSIHYIDFLINTSKRKQQSSETNNDGLSNTENIENIESNSDGLSNTENIENIESNSDGLSNTENIDNIESKIDEEN